MFIHKIFKVYGAVLNCKSSKIGKEQLETHINEFMRRSRSQTDIFGVFEKLLLLAWQKYPIELNSNKYKII
ncbi:hypothetical protein HZS_236 [Henneguya salminicola]|nr:hypothetical protein HZS_236 [Henneguya salminicola]